MWEGNFLPISCMLTSSQFHWSMRIIDTRVFVFIAQTLQDTASELYLFFGGGGLTLGDTGGLLPGDEAELTGDRGLAGCSFTILASPKSATTAVMSCWKETRGWCIVRLGHQLFFFLHLGTRWPSLLQISTKKYLITKRNSQADCRLVYEARKQSMAWMETDYSKHSHFRWKIKWRLEHLGMLGIMGEANQPFGDGWSDDVWLQTT